MGNTSRAGEQSTPTQRQRQTTQTLDPLDQLSNVFVERTIKSSVDGVPMLVNVELTFRELHDECLKGDGQMTLWDNLGANLRARNQVDNDPNYRPIKPGAGQRKYRRWRG